MHVDRITQRPACAIAHRSDIGPIDIDAVQAAGEGQAAELTQSHLGRKCEISARIAQDGLTAQDPAEFRRRAAKRVVIGSIGGKALIALRELRLTLLRTGRQQQQTRKSCQQTHLLGSSPIHAPKIRPELFQWKRARNPAIGRRAHGRCTRMEKSAAMNRDWLATARTLSEALPYLQRYDGATVVIKFGGHAMGDDEAMTRFARDIVLMKQCNVQPVIVHGGGPMINQMLDRLAIKSEFIGGKRVTDAATMEVVEMVLSGSVNKRIVQAINAQGGKAVGLSGKDANLMICRKSMGKGPGGEEIDLGLVGYPDEVNPQVLRTFLDSDFIPVVAPLGAGRAGETFNINGDTAAGAIAAGMKADRLLLLTDVAGVKDADGDVITALTSEQVRDLTGEGVIAGGMIPKTETALEAIAGGVRAVVILDGRAPHACLLELFTEHGAGSLIKG